jgi:hypothetical protein
MLVPETVGICGQQMLQRIYSEDFTQQDVI